MDNEYIPVRESHLNYYRAIPLYYENKDNTFGLYKPPGKILSDMRLEGGQYPDRLYIKHTDKLRSIHEVQRRGRGAHREIPLTFKTVPTAAWKACPKPSTFWLAITQVNPMS